MCSAGRTGWDKVAAVVSRRRHQNATLLPSGDDISFARKLGHLALAAMVRFLMRQTRRRRLAAAVADARDPEKGRGQRRPVPNVSGGGVMGLAHREFAVALVPYPGFLVEPAPANGNRRSRCPIYQPIPGIRCGRLLQTRCGTSA